MNEDDVALLRTVSLFVESPESALREVAALLTQRRMRAGEAVFHKGEPGDALYIISEGRMRVRDGDRVLNDLGHREFFGEMGVLDANPRSASVFALDDALLLRLSHDDLSALMLRRPEVARGIIHVLVQRLRARMRDMADDYVYIQQFGKVMSAAAAVESGVYEADALDDVAARTDQLGQLARVFQRMTREVYARELGLKKQVEELRIEIDRTKQAAQVSEITDTDYFQQLQSRAKELRQGKA